MRHSGDFLVLQWLRLHIPDAGGLDSIPGQGTRSYMPQLKILHAAMKNKDPKCDPKVSQCETKTQCTQINK